VTIQVRDGGGFSSSVTSTATVNAGD